MQQRAVHEHDGSVGDDDVNLRPTGLRLSRVKGEGEEEMQQPLGLGDGVARGGDGGGGGSPPGRGVAHG